MTTRRQPCHVTLVAGHVHPEPLSQAEQFCVSAGLLL